MRTDILTITLNPAVDFATTAPRIIPDVKLRCSEPHVDPGGGGINVARAIRMLGGQATALIAIGGANGARLLQLLALEGVPTVAFQGPGETRMSFSVTDAASGEQYRFVMPGPAWQEEDVARGLVSIDQATGDGTLVVLSGSQPPGVAKEFPSILAEHVRGRGARLIVDTSGPALVHLAGQPHETVFCLRMDDAEAEALAGRKLPSRTDSADFASELVARGVARNVIVARGADGSVLANAEGRWHAVAPRVPVVSKVGAGDSFVGAFALWFARGEPVAEALKAGVAAAAAAVASEATRLCDRKLTETLLAQCELTQL
ncbi:6-phosphofructokinase 2 [Meinhardsimonia xiamenensis]|jgi:6-phosphofructokinase 2|uniref:Phosphofructokinase n=1 Tax=Meinhardsimonia xiamenensis TaxID=990712 RepID=A0A1G9EDW8_9RHOB|nr:1-phosphofructokinase family hexose kinase [Meinhardsimonia xiamenensis]PRX33811.1 6-phosphofructokinase 2 [Meinhardsimonia xiamenensis]SDK74342.1 6-phosphofructokinase 2 [Meinhardsimonia xiamenensis]